MRLLILGGTTEASALARRIAVRADLQPVLSFAGRTSNLVAPPIPFRVGGFGGIEGLGAYLRAERIEAVIDATHPFAAQMSRHAAAACLACGTPLARFTRPPWVGDGWIRVDSMAEAAAALGSDTRRVFLTVGGLQLGAFAAAPQHFYLVRTIEPPATTFASQRLILARGPFSVADETALMRDERIDVLVTKNSGGTATAAKLEAARVLGIEVVMVERPLSDETSLGSVEAVLDWIEAHRPAS
jgi:precorrin-6A/cobalt-precorrin-6A reductase